MTRALGFHAFGELRPRPRRSAPPLSLSLSLSPWAPVHSGLYQKCSYTNLAGFFDPQEHAERTKRRQAGQYVLEIAGGGELRAAPQGPERRGGPGGARGVRAGRAAHHARAVGAAPRRRPPLLRRRAGRRCGSRGSAGQGPPHSRTPLSLARSLSLWAALPLSPCLSQGEGVYEPSRKKGPEAKTVTWRWNPLSSHPLAGRVGGVVRRPAPVKSKP